MEAVNIQSVVKGNVPKPSSVAVTPEVATGSKTSTNPINGQLSGNQLPSVNETVENIRQEQRDKVEETVSDLNSFVQNIQRGIQFTVHEETGRSIITITDKDSGDLIRSFPSEQVLAMAAHIAETLAVPEELGLGLLVNGKA